MNIPVAAAMLVAASQFRLPATFAMRHDLRREVETMVAQSETLRQQRELLANCRVYLRPSRDLCLRDKPFRAHATILGTGRGALIATMVIAPIGDSAE